MSEEKDKPQAAPPSPPPPPQVPPEPPKSSTPEDISAKPTAGQDICFGEGFDDRPDRISKDE